MAPFQLTAGTQLDAMQAMKDIFGTGRDIINFFSKNGMQPAATVYSINVSVGAGDSDGWQVTLKSLEVRSNTGFRYSDLWVGFPGRNVMSGILRAPFGSRWLGVLAIASLITQEIPGGDQLHNLLKRIADDEVREYVLDKEQTEKMWIMGRELFLDTSVQSQFLRIVKICGSKCPPSYMKSLYPTTEAFLTPTMLAAFRIWELSAKNSAGRKLWAQGSKGVAHLALYLSVVCGFHVTVQLESGEAQFGDEQTSVEVRILVDLGVQGDWITGYFLDDRSIEDSVRHVLLPASELILHKRKYHELVPRHHSMYTPLNEDLESPGAVNMMNLKRWQSRLEELNGAHQVSMWLMNYVQAIMFTRLISTKTSTNASTKASINEGTTKQRSHRISQRLKTAIQLLDPGLLQEDDLRTLLENVRNSKKADPISHLTKKIGVEIAKQLCDCRPPDTKGRSPHTYQCDLERLMDDMEDFAWKLWILAHVDHDSQRILRDIGLNEDWAVSNTIPFHTGWGEPKHSISNPLRDDSRNFCILPVIHTDTLIGAISLRLTGRPIPIKTSGTIGISAGGTVIGLKGNEDQSMLQDTGHCIYIIPGAMETPERRVTQIFQDPVIPGKGQWGNCMELHAIQTPLDRFGEVNYGHVINVRGDTAAVHTVLTVRGKTMGIHLLNAIDRAADLVPWQGCFGECARGKLTEEEVKKVRVIDASNYGVVVPEPQRRTLPDGRTVLAGPVASEVPSLNLILANGNILVQRAVVSHEMLIQGSKKLGKPLCVLQRGNCVHCAVRDALMRKADVLLD